MPRRGGDPAPPRWPPTGLKTSGFSAFDRLCGNFLRVPRTDISKFSTSGTEGRESEKKKKKKKKKWQEEGIHIDA